MSTTASLSPISLDDIRPEKGILVYKNTGLPVSYTDLLRTMGLCKPIQEKFREIDDEDSSSSSSSSSGEGDESAFVDMFALMNIGEGYFDQADGPLHLGTAIPFYYARQLIVDNPGREIMFSNWDKDGVSRCCEHGVQVPPLYVQQCLLIMDPHRKVDENTMLTLSKKGYKCAQCNAKKYENIARTAFKIFVGVQHLLAKDALKQARTRLHELCNKELPPDASREAKSDHAKASEAAANELEAAMLYEIATNTLRKTRPKSGSGQRRSRRHGGGWSAQHGPPTQGYGASAPAAQGYGSGKGGKGSNGGWYAQHGPPTQGYGSGSGSGSDSDSGSGLRRPRRQRRQRGYGDYQGGGGGGGYQGGGGGGGYQGGGGGY